MDIKARQHLLEEKLLNGQKGNPDFLYKPRKGDIIAVGAPKSGTTWMQQILHQIRTKGDENYDDIYNIAWFIWNPRVNGLTWNLNDEQVCNPRVFKHHEAYGIIQTNEQQKHVVIARNPYDAAFSYTKFYSRYFGSDEDLADDECAQLYQQWNDSNINPSVKCMATWFEHRNDANVLYLFYEDLLKDLEAVVRKIATFVEIPLTDEELKRVVSMCTHEYMLKNKDKFQGDTFLNRFAAAANIDTWKPKMGMVREDGGKVGQGRHIGPKVKKVIDELWKEQVENVYGFKSYDELYKMFSLFK